MSDDRKALFGEKTEELRRLVVSELLDTHRRHVEAQKVSGQTGQIVYGAIWHALPAVISKAISERWGVGATFRLPYAGYSLHLVGGTLLVPWRPPLGGDPSSTPFVTSPSRASMFDRLPADDLTLFDIELNHDGAQVEVDPALLQEIQHASGRYERVVVVAMESDPSRVWRIIWGEVTANADGTLRFYDPETIYTDDDMPNTSPTLTPSPAELDDEAFDTGAPPKPIIKKRGTGTNDR